MVTGHNVDVRYKDLIYHVQTEDRGRGHPVIESLVYLGGSIIHRVRTSYADRNDEATYSEAEITKTLDEQHRRLVVLVREGAFDPERKAFGEEFLTDRTFDECVLDFLVEQAKTQHLALEVVSQTAFLAGQMGSVTVRAINEESGQPLSGVVVRGSLMRSGGGPTPLPEVETGEDGQARVEFEVPADETVNALLVIQASSDVGDDEILKTIC